MRAGMWGLIVLGLVLVAVPRPSQGIPQGTAMKEWQKQQADLVPFAFIGEDEDDNEDETAKQESGDMDTSDNPDEVQTLPQGDGDTGGDENAPPSDPAAQRQQAEADGSQAVSTPGGEDNSKGNDGPPVGATPADKTENPDTQQDKDKDSADEKQSQDDTSMMKSELTSTNEKTKSDEKLQVVEDANEANGLTSATPTPAPPVIEVTNTTVLSPKCHIIRTIVCDNDTDTNATSPSPSPTPSPVPLIFPDNWENPDWSQTLYSPSPSPSVQVEQVPGRMPDEITNADRARVAAFVEGKHHHIIRTKNAIVVPPLPSLVSPKGKGVTLGFKVSEKPDAPGGTVQANLEVAHAQPTNATAAASGQHVTVSKPLNSKVVATQTATQPVVGSGLAFGNDPEGDFMLEDGESQKHRPLYPKPRVESDNFKIEMPLGEPAPVQTVAVSAPADTTKGTIAPDESSTHDGKHGHVEMIQKAQEKATTLPAMLRGTVSDEVYKKGIEHFKSKPQQHNSVLPNRDTNVRAFTDELANPNPAEEKIIKQFDDMLKNGLPSIVPNQMDTKLQKTLIDKQAKELWEYFEQKKKDQAQKLESQFKAPESGDSSIFGWTENGPKPWELKAPTFNTLRQGLTETVYGMFHSDTLDRMMKPPPPQQGVFGQANLQLDEQASPKALQYLTLRPQTPTMLRGLSPEERRGLQHHTAHGTRPIIDQTFEAGGVMQVEEDGSERMKMDKCGEWVWELGSKHCPFIKRPDPEDEPAASNEDEDQDPSQGRPQPSPSVSPSSSPILEIEEPNESPSSSVEPVPSQVPRPSPSESAIPIEDFEDNAPQPDDSRMLPPTVTSSPSPTISVSPTASLSVGASPSNTPSISLSPSPGASESETPSVSPTVSPTPSVSFTPSHTVSPSITSSPGSSHSPSPSQTPSSTPTPSSTRSPTRSATPSTTVSPSPSRSPTPSASRPLVPPTPSPTPTVTPTPSLSPSPEPEDCCNFDNQPEKHEIFEEGFSKGYDTGFDSGIKVAFKDIQAGLVNPSDTLTLDDQGRPVVTDSDYKEPWERESALDEEPPAP